MSNVYGIDIGTSNFKMCCKEKDTILNEKNIIAIANKKDLLAFGDEAYEMYEIRRIQAIMISILQFLLMLLK